jgi:hypothetical protein
MDHRRVNDTALYDASAAVAFAEMGEFPGDSFAVSKG